MLSIVLVIASTGLVYELAMAAVASYVLGDSVTQFSLVIGVYLSALGLGAYLSRFVDQRLSVTFVDVELSAALLGGLSAPLLFLAFAYTDAFRLVLYGIVVAVGSLVGLELPLLIRILRHQLALKDLIARALTFDYAGALVGSLAFSIWLVPKLGLIHTSIICGLLNGTVGLLSTWVLSGHDPKERVPLGRARIRAVVVLVILAITALQGGRVLESTESYVFGRVIATAQSPYQRILLAERDGVQLYLNGNLQFSSVDEHRYHEALVHPVMQAAKQHRRILIGGGGDGLAVREILEWPNVESITVVDLDAAITDLARTHPHLLSLNRNALNDPRVRIINRDAMLVFAEDSARYDVIILDFPDPSNYSLGKLYSRHFYQHVRRRLEPWGALAVQATSPLFARSAFWCIVETLQSTSLHTAPYHAFVPSFGEWGFVLAAHAPITPPRRLAHGGRRYLAGVSLKALFELPKDMERVDTRVNRLNNQALVSYYLRDWERY